MGIDVHAELAAGANYQRTVLRALEDVDNALVGFNQQREPIRRLVEQAGQSEHAAELARRRYDAGDTSYLELLDAERTELGAKDQLAAANARIGVAKADGYSHASLGGFVSFLAGRSNDSGAH